MAEKQKLSLDKLENEISKNPNNIKLRILYAERLIDEGFLLDAQDEYKDLIKISPDNPEILFNLGVTYEKQNNLDKALKCFEKASALEPDDPDFRYNVAFILDKKGESERAIQEYKNTIELNPEDSNAYFNLGYLYVQKNEPKLAIEYFKKAKEINPEDIYARFDLAYEYKKLGDLEKALEEYFELIKVCPSYSWAYFNIACILHENGDREQAVEYFLKTVETNPLDIETYKVLSDLALNSNEALDYLEEGLSKNPDNGELHYYISTIYEKMGKFDKQLYHLEKARENSDTLFINPLLVSDKIKEALKKVKK